MEKATIPYRVRQCFKCPGNTEYFCKLCLCDLCAQCEEIHECDLYTMTYRDKFNPNPKQEICLEHPSNVDRNYCESCLVTMCNCCFGYKESHRFPHNDFQQGSILSIHTYRKKRQQQRGTIHTIKREALFYRPFLLERVKADFNNCKIKLSQCQSELLLATKRLNDLTDIVQNDLLSYFDFQNVPSKQKIKSIRHIVSLQMYVHIYEQSAINPLQFISFTKTTRFPNIHLTFNSSQVSMSESLKKKDVMDSLSRLQITDRGKRHVRNARPLKLMPYPKLLHSIKIRKVNHCVHISSVTSYKVWVSDTENNIFLINTAGDTLQHIKFPCNDVCSGGVHTVNNRHELIFISKKVWYRISRLSNNMKKIKVFEKTGYFEWIPWCVYSSPSTGDLLVGMCSEYLKIGKIIRFNQNGYQKNTTGHDRTGNGLFRQPNYITENNNGDIVVSDYWFGVVVVIESGGRHRFSYTGYPLGSVLMPCGICTDTLSHILVCDDKTRTVQMLSKNGNFLSFLLTASQELGDPCSLSYDIKTRCLWVGSRDGKKICVYSYITKQDSLTETQDPLIDYEFNI